MPIKKTTRKKSRPKYKIWDAFETKSSARGSAKDLRAAGDRAAVRKISPQAGGRLKWGVFTGGTRKTHTRKGQVKKYGYVKTRESNKSFLKRFNKGMKIKTRKKR